jgi:hypothetical protein
MRSVPRQAASFDWIAMPDDPPAESATGRDEFVGAPLAKHFQVRLDRSRVRRAELEVLREEEALRAEREANRLDTEARRQQMRIASRESMVNLLRKTVLLIRSAVLLVSLVWTLLFVSLSLSHSHLASDVAPNALVRLMSHLIAHAETGVARAQAEPEPGTQLFAGAFAFR